MYETDCAETSNIAQCQRAFFLAGTPRPHRPQTYLFFPFPNKRVLRLYRQNNSFKFLPNKNFYNDFQVMSL
jgi:hypothetical protein